MSKETTNGIQDVPRQARGDIKKSFLVFLAGGLAMEWLRLKLRYARRPKAKKV